MTLQLKSSKEIAAWITARLQEIEDCGDCKVTAVTPLAEYDEGGCNWSDSIVVSTGGVPEVHFRPYLREIVREARERFNLSEDAS